MKKNTFLFLSLSIFTIVGFAQEKKSIDSSYVDYFKLTREIPYLHLNKTNFIKGEEIWFQAYVLNQKTKKLNDYTTNLYCVIYNGKGEHKLSKLLFVKNGIVSGNIKIDSTFTDNTYYIKASTNWMRNFEEDESFTQKIHIIGNKNSTENIVESDSNYDLQLLPEGGHLVESTNSVVGIIIKNKKSKGVQIKSGVLLDNKNNVIKQINTNQFGLGKISFFYEPNTTYKVKITTQSEEEIIKDIEPAKKLGLTLTIDNPNTTIIKLNIETNAATLQNSTGKKYHIYIHNTTSILKSSFILKENTTFYSSLLSAKKLSKGVNIITVISEDEKPILERVFFNYDDKLFAKINSEVLTKSRDSLSIQLSKTNNQIQYLSATFLPESTKSYSLENTMYSKFLLKPFIKGDIENSSYYFKNTNRKKLAALDLLLLNQGWSKYNWYNIFNVTPKIRFEFENGITINGSMNSIIKDSTNLILISPQSNLYLRAPIVKNRFSFNNIFLTDPSTVGFTISGKKNLIKPKIYSIFYPKLDKKNIPVSKIYDSIETTINIDKFIGERILLDEVTVKGTSKKKKNRNLSGLFGSSTSYKITDGTFSEAENILSFLRMRGFSISGIYPDQRINSQRAFAGFSVGKEATEIFLDGFEVVNGYRNDLNIISSMEVGDFEEIIISKNFGGKIYLFSNTEKVNKTGSLFNTVINPVGFAKEKSYYTPNYYSTSADIFDNYGAIFWKSKIVLDKDNYTFKIPHLNQKSIRFYIEGITSDGLIIFEEKEIIIK